MLKLVGVGVFAVILAILAIKLLVGIFQMVIPIVLLVGGIWLLLKIFNGSNKGSSKQPY